MASLTFQRAGWLLQVSRTPRNLSFSFTVPLSRRYHHRKLSPPRPQAPISPFPPPSTYHQARRAFSSAPRQQATTDDASTSNPTQQTAPSSSQQAARSPPSSKPTEPSINDLSSGFSDAPSAVPEGQSAHVDWSRSFHGLSVGAFSPETAKALLAPLDPADVEVKPDGIVYLPEIKYRRILNRAFGPGGWGLAPRGETIVTPKAVTREYALVALGRLVSVARGEQDYFSPEGIPTATEGCKSNALLRCCKDLGVASELWDPRFIRKYLTAHVKEVWVEHTLTKKKKKIFVRRDDRVVYPWKEVKV